VDATAYGCRPYLREITVTAGRDSKCDISLQPVLPIIGVPKGNWNLLLGLVGLLLPFGLVYLLARLLMLPRRFQVVCAILRMLIGFLIPCSILLKMAEMIVYPPGADADGAVILFPALAVGCLGMTIAYKANRKMLLIACLLVLGVLALDFLPSYFLK
jgi:hypothetical protein